MKTADLIPFILLELNEGDKYGFELTKSIETKTNSNIIIKQPTLYTLLKKLEKSKFITSYWQDSEIGGKRHYYKLTENGKLQVSTLPSYDFLIKNILNSSNEEYEEQQLEENVTTVLTKDIKTEKRFSIMDELLNNQPEPKESILPSEEIFENNNLDNLTELDINLSNANLLKDEKIKKEETFANHESVATFTQKTSTEPINVYTEENTSKHDYLFELEFTTPINTTEIKYVDYVNFKNTESYKYSKKLSINMLLKTLSTSVYIILMSIICSIITNYTGRSTLYYIFFISSLIFAVFYPVIYLLNVQKFRLKYQKVPYQFKKNTHLYVGLTIILATIIISVLANIKIGNNTLEKILIIKNFENTYAPALFSLSILADLIFKYAFIKKLNK